MLELKVLKDDERQAIIDSAFRVMEEVGVDVYNEKALEIYKDLGCSVEGNRVKISADLVKKAIETTPQYIKMYDRDGNLAMDLGGSNSYYGSGPTCTNFLDLKTGERRPSTKQDAYDTAFVSDALPTMDYVMSLVMINDCPIGFADIHEVDAMLRGTKKPLATWAFTAENIQTIIDLAAAVKGGLEELQAKPNIIVYAEPTTPLMHGKDALDKVMILAKNKIPVIYAPGMLTGATAPMTLAGAMTVGITEVLSALVLHQTVCPGAPYICSCGGCGMDMKEMKTPYVSPEGILLYACSTEIFRNIGIPTFGLAGVTDAKTVDAQAGYESAINLMMNELTGANLIHDVGFIDYGLTGSIPQMVMCDEIISLIRNFTKGIVVDEDTLAFDVIKNVGPGGNFLSEEHTFRYFKANTWMPTIAERRSYEEWEADGKKDLKTIIDEKIAHIMETHTVEPLSDEVIAKMDQIIADAEARGAAEK